MVSAAPSRPDEGPRFVAENGDASDAAMQQGVFSLLARRVSTMRVALVIFGILVAVIIANGVRIASRVEQHPLDH
jgi:hypothetical protein